MRLILHAGTHKTGTTSIQKVLADNRNWLRERGLVYPDGGSAFGKSEIPHHRFVRSLNGTDAEAERKAKLFICEARQSAGPSDTIIISTEAVYKHLQGYSGWDRFTHTDYWQRREHYLCSVAEALSEFEVEVLIFFRQRDSFAKSLYDEVIGRNYWRGSFPEFLADFAPWFQYERQIESFRNAFSSVTVMSYDDALSKGLIATFFEAIGFPMPPGAEGVWERRSSALQSI